MFTNNCVLNLIDSTKESNVLFPNEIKGKAKEFDPIGTNLVPMVLLEYKGTGATFAEWDNSLPENKESDSILISK